MFRILKTWILNLFRVFGFMISDFGRYMTNLESRERLKRKHARVDVVLKICAKHEYKMDLCDSNVIDISETGLCFKTDILYPIKSELELELEFPQDFGAKEETRSFYALSEVKQIKKTANDMYLTGVEFKKIYPRFRRRLNKFLKMKLEEKKMRACIIYFSLTGNTHKLAQVISQGLKHKNFDVDLVRLEPADGAKTFAGQGMTALQRKRVNIGDVNFALSMYDLILFGSPVWAFSPAPALNTYLEKCYGLEGKKTVVFYTYGSGTGKSRAVKIVKKILEGKGARSVSSILIGQRKLKDQRDIIRRVEQSLENILYLHGKIKYNDERR
ncbi:PilZ domain-containing protein [bacterium]|nr:PilZ domain-containing protein [bacterium]